MDDARLGSERDAWNCFRTESPIPFGPVDWKSAARQLHLFNIPFDVARESNSLHSKRMKESSNQSREKSSTSRRIRHAGIERTSQNFNRNNFQTKEGANDAT